MHPRLRAGSAPSRCRSTSLRAGCSFATCSPTRAPHILIVEAAQIGALETIAADGLSIEHLWTIDPAAGALGALEAVPLPPLGEPIASASLRPGDTFAILYTSGTTGPSKGVCCPHAQYFWWGVLTANLLGVREGDVLVTPLPLFHTNALNTFFQALLTGARSSPCRVSPLSGFWQHADRDQGDRHLRARRDGADAAVAARERTRSGRTMVRVALAPGRAGRHCRRASSRAPASSWPTATARRRRTTSSAVRPGPSAPGSMGPVVAGFHARVVDEDDNIVPAGVAGELILRADEPFAFATGYWAMPEKTVEAWRNLWFHSGDRVIRDADDTFRFVDRMKDAIRRRGENISSYEVEQVLLSHPDIATAAAFPARSELAEDEVMAAIVPKPGLSIDPVAVIRFCEGRMPYFAIPRYIVFETSLPATENGKIQKYKLIGRGITPETWDREAAGIVVARR